MQFPETQQLELVETQQLVFLSDGPHLSPNTPKEWQEWLESFLERAKAYDRANGIDHQAIVRAVKGSGR